MKLTQFSYRYAIQILQHPDYAAAWSEIEETFSQAPLFIWPGKSKKTKGADVVQQLMNTYFDRILAVDKGWEHHPLATKIVGSNLRADFRKQFDNLAIQIEVQFGNMARWYSDLFKFQAGYSAQAVHLGLSVVPMGVLARRIDQNVVNFERAARELPAADLSITLPILMLGLEPDKETPIIDVSRSLFVSIKDITGAGNESNRWRIVNGYLAGADIESIGPESPIGSMLRTGDDADQEDASEESL